MVNIPENQVTEADIQEWYMLQDKLKTLKTNESILRSKIFKGLFPTPKEGTNIFDLSQGYVLKGKYSLTRTIDIGALQALRTEFESVSIPVDSLIKWEPSLKLKEYRELTAEQMTLFDQCLTIKPGSPALEIVLPAKAKK